MSNPQKSITISILKAYNWNQPQNNDRFEFCFYSSLTKALILQKIINAHIINNQLIINTSLKITYTPQESEIILKMGRIGDDKSNRFINEFVINLDLLQERKMQYLPFSKNDKILEVVCGVAHRDDTQQRKPVITINKFDSFIQQKQVFLKNISVKSYSKIGIQQKHQSKRTFTQKLYALLQETKRLRSKIQTQKNTQPFLNVEYNTNQSQKDRFLSADDQSNNQRLLIKSSSQNLLIIPKPLLPSNAIKNKDINIIDKKANKTNIKKYKLDLKSLLLFSNEDPNLNEDNGMQDEDEVLRSKQENFATYKYNRNHLSSYLHTTGHDN